MIFDEHKLKNYYGLNYNTTNVQYQKKIQAIFTIPD